MKKPNAESKHKPKRAAGARNSTAPDSAPKPRHHVQVSPAAPAGDDTTPPVTAPPNENMVTVPTGGPQFGEPVATPDPNQFTVQHGSDNAAYKILDSERGTLKPRPFPIAAEDEPRLTLAAAIGPQGASVEAEIQKAGQIVFHSVGDTGNTKGPRTQESVADKMASDFDEQSLKDVPSFFYHLGDVVYSFGESQYYYDQFYDPYRSYPAPIFAIAGNHDGMVAPNVTTPSLQAFLDNFCAAGQPSHRTPESGGLVRTAQIQPGVYFTLEAPFVRLLSLYSNCLEDPGVLSTQGGAFPYLTDKQIDYLTAALKRVKSDKFTGAVVIALHHPPYVAATQSDTIAGKHGGSPDALKDIDAACAAAGVWPHAVLSGHAHNYQRFTRTQAGRQTPFLVAGNGGHGLARLTKKSQPTLRTPLPQDTLSDGTDTVVFENYDDQDYGYLRLLVDPQQLRIEYHPASDGQDAKTPDDFVTVDLASHTLVHFLGA